MIQNVQNDRTTTTSISQVSTNVVAPRTAPQLHSSIDRITFGNEKGFIGSFFGKISSGVSSVWGVIKSIFKTIFFCFNYVSKAEEKLDLKGLTTLKDTFTKLRKDFDSKKGSLEGLKKWWKGEFGSSSETVQRRIACKHLEGIAKGKLGENASLVDLQDFARKSYEYSDERNKALRFVRDLEFISKGNEQWHPLTPTNVPAGVTIREKDLLPKYLDSIISDLDGQISKMKNSGK